MNVSIYVQFSFTYELNISYNHQPIFTYEIYKNNISQLYICDSINKKKINNSSKRVL